MNKYYMEGSEQVLKEVQSTPEGLTAAEAEARADERRSAMSMRPRNPKKQELRNAAMKREAYKERLRTGEEILHTGPQMPAHVCHYCGRMVNAPSTQVYTNMGAMLEYTCPRCGRVNMTKVGT